MWTPRTRPRPTDPATPCSSASRPDLDGSTAPTPARSATPVSGGHTAPGFGDSAAPGSVGAAAPGAAAGSRATSPLRRILEEINGAHEAVSLDEIARRIGITRDEADAMVAYWVRKGRLSSDDLTAACPSGGCGTCPSGDNGTPGCGTRRDGPVLLAITRRPQV